MTRRRLHALTAWLLPWICLRALLPAGFMPIATADGWQVVMCRPGTFQAATKQLHDHHLHGDHVAHGHSDHTSADHSGSPTTNNDGTCSFALSASPSLIPFVANTEFGFSPEQGFVRLLQAQQIARPIARSQQSRAPPFYS